MALELLTIKVGNLTFSTFQDEHEYIVKGVMYRSEKPRVSSESAWRWHCKAANGELVCTSGESFDSKGNAERAMRNFLLTISDALKEGLYSS